VCNGSEKLRVRVDARAAELEYYRMRLGSPHDSSNRFHNVFHIDRLLSGPAAAAVSYCFIAGAPGSTAATPSGLMLKAKNINGSLPGFPHWCTRAYGS